MANLQDFIQMVVTQTGVNDQTARGAAGSLLSFLKDQVADADFQELAENLSGAESLIQESQGAEKGGAGGGLGGLLGSAASAIGGGGGSALGLVRLLTQSGLDMGQIGAFVPMFVNFARQQLGEGLINRLLDQVPDLKNLMP